MSWTQLIADTFTESGQPALASHAPDQGRAWVDVAAGLQLHINGTSLKDPGGSYTIVGISLNRQAFPSKQAAEIVCGSGGEDAGYGLFTRARGTSGGGESTVSGYHGLRDSINDVVYIYRADAGSYTALGSSAAAGGFSAGDILRLESDGSTHTLFFQGVQKKQETDATYPVGKVGIRALGNAANFADEFRAFGWGPIAIVQEAANNDDAGTVQVTVNNVVAGNALLIVAYTFNDTTWTVTDTNGTPVEDIVKYHPDLYVSSLFSVLNCAAGTHTIELTGGATNCMLQVWEVSGLALSNAFDQSATERSSSVESSIVVGPTGTTTLADELVIAFIHAGTPGTYTSTDGDDSQEVNDGTFLRDAMSAVKIVFSTGAKTMSFTSSNSVVHEALIGTYKAASGQFGRPVSDISAGGWTASTGSDLFAMVDEETINDSDYIKSNTGGASDAAVLEIADLITPSDGDVKVIVRHRAGA